MLAGREEKWHGQRGRRRQRQEKGSDGRSVAVAAGVGNDGAMDGTVARERVQPTESQVMRARAMRSWAVGAVGSARPCLLGMSTLLCGDAIELQPHTERWLWFNVADRRVSITHRPTATLPLRVRAGMVMIIPQIDSSINASRSRGSLVSCNCPAERYACTVRVEAIVASSPQPETGSNLPLCRTRG